MNLRLFIYFRKPKNTQPDTSTTRHIFLAEYYQVYSDDKFKTN